MRIILLTHEREFDRKTGTGILVQQHLDFCDIIRWYRKEPDPVFGTLDQNKTLLIYPGKDSDTDTNIDDYENFILLDGTWQEARKIYNRSPYLRNFREYELKDTPESIYTLRRNQVGLCTVETVVELLKRKGKVELAESLFKNFTTVLSS